MHNQTRALVTGASSGIGAATVHALRAHEATVYAAARRIDRLEKLADETGAIAVELDVTDPDAVTTFGAHTEIDVLINNAGLGRAMGSLADASISDITRTIGTNVTGLLLMTNAVLPGMIKRGNGHIVNISSTAAIHAGATALYSASKAAVHKLSRDLRCELAGTGVRVTEINPGRVTTEFYDVAVDDPAMRAKLQQTGITELSPHDVAASIMHCVNAPWHVNISQLEIVPSEQVYGGYGFHPFTRP